MKPKTTCVFTAVCRVHGNNSGPFKVSLYDSRRELLCSRITDQNGAARFELPCCGEYSVCASSCGLSPKGICSWVKICSGDSMKYFIFSDFDPFPSEVFFKLEDANYSGLPISQGVIYLWQK